MLTEDKIIYGESLQTYAPSISKSSFVQPFCRRVVATTGSITDKLREDWQLVDVMKELNLPKYEALGWVESFEDKDGRIIKQIKDWTRYFESGRAVPPMSLGQLRAEAKSHLESLLVSVKGKNKIVTTHVNCIKKRGGTLFCLPGDRLGYLHRTDQTPGCRFLLG